jgi:GNAT superfamily N-acetyltransferase
MTASAEALLAQLRQALPAAYGLRQRSEADLPFLCQLYAQTREDELAPVPWTAQQKQAFLADQFDKQHRHYLQHYPRAQWWVLTCQEAPVGRLYLEQTARELRIMDVSLMPDHRNHGLGTALMRALLGHTDDQQLTLSLHVEPFNPALRLYQRLGFVHAETRGIYLFMQRPPTAGSVKNEFVARVAGIAPDGNHE